jgi:hypothetical protein
LQERARVFNLPVFSRAEFTKMVCKCSLVERLDLLPIAVLLMIGGKLADYGKVLPLPTESFAAIMEDAQKALQADLAGLELDRQEQES